MTNSDIKNELRRRLLNVKYYTSTLGGSLAGGVLVCKSLESLLFDRYHEFIGFGAAALGAYIATGLCSYSTLQRIAKEYQKEKEETPNLLCRKDKVICNALLSLAVAGAITTGLFVGKVAIEGLFNNNKENIEYNSDYLTNNMHVPYHKPDTNYVNFSERGSK
jgi:hypothetical protein